MTSVADLLDAAIKRLVVELDARVCDARLDARVLAAHAWGQTSAWLIAHDQDTVDEPAQSAFQALVDARASGAPVAYLVGYREFYGHRFAVDPCVLIPRPETELLVEAALARLPGAEVPARVLDLGTGSGCIAISIALANPQAIVDAVDLSDKALAVARKNAQALAAKVRFIQSDWFATLDGQPYDCIVSNPPYLADHDGHLARGDLRFEPRSALVAANAGLDDLRIIAQAALARLSPGGCLLMEHGCEQGEAVAALLRAAGYAGVETLHDLAGLPRIGVGRKGR
jgi:release factor glutamine methyltransferase